MDTAIAVFFTLLTLGIPAAIIYVLYKQSQAEAKLRWFCSSCESFSQGVKKTKRGSGWVELALWLCFIAPGFIYSVWRSATKNRACPSCGARMLIPADAPKAKRATASG